MKVRKNSDRKTNKKNAKIEEKTRKTRERKKRGTEMKEKQTDFYNGRVWIFIGWHGLVLEFF